MGRLFGPLASPARRLASRAFRHARLAVLMAIPFSWGAADSVAAPALDRAPPASATTAAAASRLPDQSLLKADSIVYAHDKATAVGHVQIYYQGRVLQADRVTFDRGADRVLAEGHAKLTEADGSVVYGRQFELTQDFKSGFIDAIQAETSDKTFFTAPRAERAEGETTTFERGAYTAC
jgi:LPS-assembly protein